MERITLAGGVSLSRIVYGMWRLGDDPDTSSGHIMAKIEGLQAGCVEALMLNHKGEVAECTGDNIFIIKRGILLTPPKDAIAIEQSVVVNADLRVLFVVVGAVDVNLKRHTLVPRMENSISIG